MSGLVDLEEPTQTALTTLVEVAEQVRSNELAMNSCQIKTCNGSGKAQNYGFCDECWQCQVCGNEKLWWMSEIKPGVEVIYLLILEEQCASCWESSFPKYSQRGKVAGAWTIPITVPH